MEKTIKQFQVKGDLKSITTINEGLINSTFLVLTTTEKYILQKINTFIFKNVEELMFNINSVTTFLKKQNKTTLTIVKNKNNELFIIENGEYWRMFNFIENTQTFDKATSTILASESGKTIAKFHKSFSDFTDTLYNTIPNFHNTGHILNQFKDTLTKIDEKLKKECIKEINFILEKEKDCNKIQKLIKKGKIEKKVCHNDTKISNILFDKDEKSVCLIDFDTIMIGTILTDISDAIRTICVSETEEESDLTKVHFKLDYFKCFILSYLKENERKMSKTEIDNIVFSVKLIFLEQGIRFLEDYLNGDIYYNTKHDKQNLVRAKNQLHLCLEVEKQTQKMNDIISDYFN